VFSDVFTLLESAPVDPATPVPPLPRPRAPHASGVVPVIYPALYERLVTIRPTIECGPSDAEADGAADDNLSFSGADADGAADDNLSFSDAAAYGPAADGMDFSDALDLPAAAIAAAAGADAFHTPFAAALASPVLEPWDSGLWASPGFGLDGCPGLDAGLQGGGPEALSPFDSAGFRAELLGLLSADTQASLAEQLRDWDFPTPITPPSPGFWLSLLLGPS